MSRLFKKIISLSYAMPALPQGSFRHFSFLVRRNNIVSVGWNLPNKTHPLAMKYGHRYSTIHAELHCLINGPNRLDDPRLKMVNIRIGRNGKVLLSKPCTACENMLRFVGIKTIFFSNNDGFFEELSWASKSA
jgi:tRNA(Arg) A34 adenosine deaminase TadA